MDLRQLTSRAVEDAFGMWRYRLLAIVVAWCIAFAGWAWVVLLPSQYDATARVYVNTETTLKPLLRDLTVSTDTLTGVSLVTQALLSQPQLRAVAVETGLEARTSNPAELERLIERLKREIGISKMPRQDIYSITYRDRDPQMARNVVQVLLTSFMQNSLRNNRTDSAQAQAFLQQQIKLYEQRLVEAEERLAGFKKQNVGVMPGEGGGYFARLQAAETELRAAQGEIRAVEERRNELLRQVEGEEPVLGILGGAATTGTSVDGPIADLEAELGELRVKYTDRYPEVVRVRQTLEDLYRIREQEREKAAATRAPVSALDVNPVYQQMRVALSAAEAELASMRATVGQKQSVVSSLRRMVDTLPEVEAQLNRLNRDYDVVKKQYDALVQRLESARLSEEVQAENEQLTFEVIEPPRLPLFPSSPNRLLLFTAVMIVALGGGLAVAFLLNQHNPVFFTGRQLRAATGMPVFGTISVIRGQGRSWRDWSFGTATAMLVVAFVTLVVTGGTGFGPGPA